MYYGNNDWRDYSLAHGWGWSPKQKAAEKKYNAEYYQRNKEKWRKYNDVRDTVQREKNVTGSAKVADHEMNTQRRQIFRRERIPGMKEYIEGTMPEGAKVKDSAAVGFRPGYNPYQTGIINPMIGQSGKDEFYRKVGKGEVYMGPQESKIDRDTWKSSSADDVNMSFLNDRPHLMKSYEKRREDGYKKIESELGLDKKAMKVVKDVFDNVTEPIMDFIKSIKE